MKELFKNKKVEITGLLAWSLLSFAAINISIQLYQQLVLPIFLASFVCCLLHSFFLMAFYEFELTIHRLSIFTFIYIGLILAFQFIFDGVVRLIGPVAGGLGYIVMFISLLFWGMVNGVIIRSLCRAKK